MTLPRFSLRTLLLRQAIGEFGYDPTVILIPPTN